MDTAIDVSYLSDASKALDLANIRFQLIRLEDTITFHMIERVQFPLSRTIYIPGGVKIPDSDLSLMSYLLREQERLQSRVRRYQSPDEYPFFPDVLEEPILQRLEYPKILHPNTVNVNAQIMEKYVNAVLPAACRKFDREDRGDRITTRVECGEYFETRDNALRAHATQVDPDGFWFHVPLEIQQKVWPTEDFELARSLVDSPVPESDLFAGIRERARTTPGRNVA